MRRSGPRRTPPRGAPSSFIGKAKSSFRAISENGKLSLTRTLEATEAEQLQHDLPQLALSAELQGIDTSFPTVLLDENCLPLRDTIERVFAQRPDLMGVETPPATVKLNLTPESWRQQRAALARQKEWQKRLLWAGGAYAATFLLFALYVVVLRFQVGHLKNAIKRDAPKVDFIKQTETDWKALAPAIDPHYYPIEVMLHLFESLPNPEVRITVTINPRAISRCKARRPPAALAYQFAEKVKKNPGSAGVSL